MKKSFTLFSTIALLSMCVSFTSCMDEDTERSMALSGQWTGDWGMYYDYQDYYGRVYRCYSYRTDIVFYPDYDYATHGYGYQVDWYGRDSYYEKLSFRFVWSIRNGIVDIYYPGYHEYDTFIRDYSLSNNYFRGYLGNSNTSFRLSKIWDYYNWSYYYGYDYYPWEWGYYGKTRTDSGEEAPAPNGQIIKIGSKYME